MKKKVTHEITPRMFGPKYPPGEWVFVEEVGWAVVNLVFMEDDKWVYQVKSNGETYEVRECSILV